MHQLGVFKKLSKAQGPLTAQQLGEQTGGDPLLIGEHPIFTSPSPSSHGANGSARMMRSLTPNGVANEVGPETYAPTGVTHLYAQPAWDAGLRFAYAILPLSSSPPPYGGSISRTLN